MKRIDKVEWGMIAFAALVILGQAVRVYPQLLLGLGGIIIGVVIEKVCRWRKERQDPVLHAIDDLGHQNCRCEIVPFPGETCGGDA